MAVATEVVLKRDCAAQQVPQGAPVALSAGTRVTIVQSLGDWHTVLTARRQMLRVAAEDSDALGVGPPEKPAGAAPGPEQTSLEERCLEALRTCYDPELPVNVVDLGLVYSCQVSPLFDGGHDVLVLMTLTSPGCGMADMLKMEIEEKLAEQPGVARVRVEIVFDPPWDMARMTDAARLQLGLL